MYAYRDGALGEEIMPPKPAALVSYCSRYPSDPQCTNPKPAPVVAPWLKGHWGILVGVALAGFVVYKVAS